MQGCRVCVLLPAIFALLLCGCSNEDRIASLEEWKAYFEQQLVSLGAELDKVTHKDYVTSVTPLEDDSGYTISFKYSPDLEIRNGKDGDPLFTGFDNSHPDYLLITLADGKSYRLLKYSEIYISFDSYEPFLWTAENNTVPLVLSPYFRESDYMALSARVNVISGEDQDVVAGQESGGWKVTLTPPVFEGHLYREGSAKVTLTAPEDKSISVLLTVTLLDKKGREHSVSRIIRQ